jgi:hypothetical protein
MIDQVAKALCGAAGRSGTSGPGGPLSPACLMCDRDSAGKPVCAFWPSFRSEAEAAIKAAHARYRENRRWPNFAR